MECRTNADAARVGQWRARRRADERMHTYSALAVAFVDAEHRYVPSQIAVPVRRLLAYDNAYGMRDAMGVCLYSMRQLATLRARRSFLRGRKGGA
jgi:hypothetical protein